MYADKIMAYGVCEHAIREDTHRSTPLRKVHNTENDNGKAEKRA